MGNIPPPPRRGVQNVLGAPDIYLGELIDQVSVRECRSIDRGFPLLFSPLPRY